MTDDDVRAELRKRLQFADSYTRAGRLFEVFTMDQSPEAWALVGQHWNSCDNLAAYRSHFDFLFRLYRTQHGFPIAEAMDAEARAVYDALPAVVTVYRGCYERNRRGMSWTLERDVAERFPSLTRYRGPGQPLLVTGHVKRADVAFITLDREESEVVALWRCVRALSVDTLDARRD